MPYIQLNNINFYYEVEGEGFPLVLIAGLSRDNSNWNLVRGDLAKKFKIIMLDNRSVGRSEAPAASYSIAEMGEDIVRLLDHLHISKAHFLGHSMGGAVAQTIAHQHPNYVEQLIISHSLIKATSRTLFWMHHCAALYDANKSPEETIPVTAPWIFSNHFFKDPKNIEQLIAIRKSYSYPQSARGYRQQMEAIEIFDSTLWVDQLSVPTCIIAGKEDILAPAEQSYEMHQRIKNSRFILQEGAHAPMFEAPEAYTEDVLKFLMSFTS